jgi:hypothetical protein
MGAETDHRAATEVGPMWDVLIVVLMLVLFGVTLALVPGLTRLMGR